MTLGPGSSFNSGNGHKPITLLASLAAAAALTGCANNLPDLDVEEQWTEAMKRQSLYAIFPITEDFMVGDVLLDTRDTPDAQENDAFDVTRIATPPAHAVFLAICADRRNRMSVEPSRARATGSATQEFDIPETTPCPTTEQEMADLASHPITIGDVRNNKTDGVRLSMSRIPNLTVARLTQAQLNGYGTLQAIGLNVGANKSSEIGMSIKLQDLQSLEVEPTTAVRLLRQLVDSKSARVPDPYSTLEVMWQRWPEGTRAICEGRFDDASAMKIAIVTRVEYAGRVEYSFSNQRMQAIKGTLDASGAIGALPTGGVDAQATGGAPPASGADSNAAQELAGTQTALVQQLGALANGVSSSAKSPGAAGGSFSIAMGTSGEVGLIETFPRPLAVGAGAKMNFPAQDALLPQHAEDVRSVIYRCAEITGVDGVIRGAANGSVADASASVSFRDRLKGLNFCAPGDRTLSGEARKLAGIRDYLCASESCVDGCTKEPTVN